MNRLSGQGNKSLPLFSSSRRAYNWWRLSLLEDIEVHCYWKGEPTPVEIKLRKEETELLRQKELPTHDEYFGLEPGNNRKAQMFYLKK
jgi:hypothetical protein